MVISLEGLMRLAVAYPDAAGRTPKPVCIEGLPLRDDGLPVLMGTLNLSRDSTYRESIAVSRESALRKARVMAAAGADIVDIGAESSTAAARRVSAQEQIDSLVPLISALAGEGIVISAETYEPEVVEACLQAGARILNLTGTEHHERILALAAEHRATVILCYVGGANVRDITDVPLDEDPIPPLHRHFAERIETARAAGVTDLVIDPGMGFYYGNLVEPLTRARHQARVLLNSFRLLDLDQPLGHALPHAFDLFEEEFRSAEAFFAVLASLGGASLWRTHEIERVRPVRRALAELSP